MNRILLNESGTFYKIIIVFCAELSETNCRAELSAPNCPTPKCPRRIVRAELSCAELSGNRVSLLIRNTILSSNQQYSYRSFETVFHLSLLRVLPKNNESAFCRLLKTDLYRRGWAGGASE